MEDAESLRHAFLELKQTAAELQQEWAEANLLAEIQSLETEVLEERTANEVSLGAPGRRPQNMSGLRGRGPNSPFTLPSPAPPTIRSWASLALPWWASA